MTATTDTAPVSQPFQAEVAELLHLMVHSVYSETDIFLRELISNASDACDRLRYEAIARPELIGDGEGIHWPDVDEDLSTEGLLRGAPAAPEPMRTR